MIDASDASHGSSMTAACRHALVTTVATAMKTIEARRADLHLAVRPGTDLPVALSVADWLFRSGAADLEFLERHATGVEAFRERVTRPE